jgi:hypothetical protein
LDEEGSPAEIKVKLTRLRIRILSESDIFLRIRKKVKTQILYLLGGRGVVAAGFELTLAVGSIPAQENRIRHRTYKYTSTVHTYGTEPKYLSYPAYLSNVSDNLLSSVADPAPDPVGSVPFCRIQIRIRMFPNGSGSRIWILPLLPYIK